MKCEKCGSTNVTTKDCMKRTCRPKDVKPNPFRKTTYGYFYTEYTCECGYKWEVKK